MAPKGNQYWKLRQTHGKPKKFTPEGLWKAAEEYFDWSQANPWMKAHYSAKADKIVYVPCERPFTISALCDFIGIDQTTFSRYGDDQDYRSITTRVREIIYTQKFEGAAVGVFNANIIARDLGLRDKQEIEHSGRTNYSEMTDEELNERIRKHEELRKRIPGTAGRA